MAIEKGTWIKVEYIGTFDDGTVFDSTELNENIPLKFEVGAGQIIEGFDKSVVGKKIGDEFKIRLEPTDAYGQYHDGLIQKAPREQFPKNVEPQPGMMLLIMGPHGQPMPATIKEVEEEFIILDLNHPMAGKTLNFNIKIVETDCEPDPPDACGCGCGHDHDPSCSC